MTIDEIVRSDKVILTPADVAEAIHAEPQVIRLQAREDPSVFGFPVIVVGKRVKIPRIPFIQFICGGNQNDQKRS